MPESYMVPWEDVLAYFRECRERALQEITEAEDTKAVGKAQGKIELLNELLNLKAVFQAIATAQEEAKPKPFDPRRMSREAYRARLQGNEENPI